MTATITLNNGVKMPQVGFGVFQIMDLKQCEEAVLTAIETGYRNIDTASAYMNERAIGDAVRKSGIKREEIFITTKLWIQDASYEKAKIAFDKSLNELQMDYIDLYLIHQPFADVYGAWRAMQELYKAGKIKAIGVSNFQPDRLVDLSVNNEIVPMVNQIEINPFQQQQNTQKLIEDNNTIVESWAPFAEGKNNIFKNELLTNIGKKYNKTVAQVILRWLLQRNIVMIPKSVHGERIQENFNIFDFELSNQDMEQIKTLDTGESMFLSHNDVATVRNLNGWKIHE